MLLTVIKLIRLRFIHVYTFIKLLVIFINRELLMNELFIYFFLFSILFFRSCFSTLFCLQNVFRYSIWDYIHKYNKNVYCRMKWWREVLWINPLTWLIFRLIYCWKFFRRIKINRLWSESNGIKGKQTANYCWSWLNFQWMMFFFILRRLFYVSNFFTTRLFVQSGIFSLNITCTVNFC